MKCKKPHFFIGLDTHKKFTEYIVRDNEGNCILCGKSASNPIDLRPILEPYLHSCIIGLECNLESYPIFDSFHSEGIDIRVGNTIHLRTLVGKNDTLDAKRISDMLRLDTFPTAYIPTGNIRFLRSLVNVRHGILEENIRVKNKIKAFTRKLCIILPRGELGKKHIQILMQYLAIHPEKIDLRYTLDHYLSISQSLEKVTAEMISFAKSKFKKQFDAIINLKGIGEISATYFISEICPINRFASEKKLRRYVGVIPCTSISAGKTYSTTLPKTTSRGILRWAIVQAAHCMIMHNENIRRYYNKKLKEKKRPSKAIMCVARSVSDVIYKTLNTC